MFIKLNKLLIFKHYIILATILKAMSINCKEKINIKYYIINLKYVLYIK